MKVRKTMYNHCSNMNCAAHHLHLNKLTSLSQQGSSCWPTQEDNESGATRTIWRCPAYPGWRCPIHRTPWPRGSTVDNVSQQYIKYMTKMYGAAIIISYWKCTGPATKDSTHLRRKRTSSSVTVNLTGAMIIQCKTKAILSNEINKQDSLIISVTSLS